MAMIMQLFTGLSLGVGDIPVDKINCQPVEILDYIVVTFSRAVLHGHENVWLARIFEYCCLKQWF